MADPTPPESIRERILANCATSLLAINGTGNYHHALSAVERGKAVPEDLQNLPVAFIEEGDETYSQDTNLLLTRSLPITVEAWFRSEHGDLPTQSNRMLADLERALLVDPLRGRLAQETTLVGNSTVRDESPGVLGSVRLQLEVQYHTLRRDPASLG